MHIYSKKHKDLNEMCLIFLDDLQDLYRDIHILMKIVFELLLISIKLKLFVCMVACSFAYSSRTYVPICLRHDMFMVRDQKKILEKSRLSKSVLDSSPGEEDFC
jgi:hypothetical protein